MVFTSSMHTAPLLSIPAMRCMLSAIYLLLFFNMWNDMKHFIILLHIFEHDFKSNCIPNHFQTHCNCILLKVSLVFCYRYFCLLCISLLISVEYFETISSFILRSVKNDESIYFCLRYKMGFRMYVGVCARFIYYIYCIEYTNYREFNPSLILSEV